MEFEPAVQSTENLCEDIRISAGVNFFCRCFPRFSLPLE